MRMLIRHTIVVGRSKVHINPFGKKINAGSRKRARTNFGGGADSVGKGRWAKKGSRYRLQ